MTGPGGPTGMKRFASASRQRQAWRARWRAWPRSVRVAANALLLVLAGGLLVAALFGNRIAGWLFPDSRGVELRQQAEHALQQGRLTAADGSGARELFDAALAVQPDQVAARDGLARVGLAALAQAARDIELGRYAQARAGLRLARELQVPRARIAALEAALHARVSDQAGVERLLAQADLALAAGRLDDGEDAALPLYQRVLALQPRNQRAVEGREDALAELLQPAARALQAGDAATLAGLIARAEKFDAGHMALPELRAGLSRLQDAGQRRLQSLIAGKRFEAAAMLCAELRAGSGILPAPCGGEVIEGLAALARRAAGDFDFASSEHLLALGGGLAPGHAQLAAAERQLLQARVGASRLPQTPRNTRRVAARVASLLAEAAQAQARGDWLTPPGESAWDKLRAAQALAPRDPAVGRALAGLKPAARRCHAESLRDNQLQTAQACLDVWRQVAPADPGLTAARRRLAERWVAMGEQRLDAGEVAAARRALERARALDGAAAGLSELDARLSRAQAPAP